jgi:hypothetical protein
MVVVPEVTEAAWRVRMLSVAPTVIMPSIIAHPADAGVPFHRELLVAPMAPDPVPRAVRLFMAVRAEVDPREDRL